MKPTSALAISLCLALAGCKSTTGVDRAEDTAQNLRDIKQSLVDSPEKINTVSASLATLTKEGVDMKAQFATFSKEVDALVAHRDHIRGLRAELQANKTAFTGEWDKRMQDIKDEQLRKRAEERRASVAEKLDELAKLGDSAREEFEPWMQKVLDVRTYLENDLNPTGVKSVSDVISAIGKGAPPVNKKLTTIVGELEEVSTAIAAAKPPAPPQEPKQ